MRYIFPSILVQSSNNVPVSLVKLRPCQLQTSWGERCVPSSLQWGDQEISSGQGMQALLEHPDTMAAGYLVTRRHHSFVSNPFPSLFFPKRPLPLLTPPVARVLQWL